MMRSVGGAVEGQRTVAGDVLLVGDLEPLGEAWETTCFGLLIERDADGEEDVDGEFGPDGGLVAVVRVEFKEVEEGFCGGFLSR